MKICAIICEFNPFHNGHRYLIEQAKKQSQCDAVLCIMSGNFTQRGDMCVADKYTRAKHAVLGGADLVIQLPSVFAVAPAEIFAEGAIKILSSIPEVTHLSFGCECGDKQKIQNAARILIDESDNFKNVLSDYLDKGESYAKSYAEAFDACGGDKQLIEKPNNILAIEYTKSIIRLKADINILPVKRIGGGYNDTQLTDSFSSASAIRRNLDCEEVKSSLPDYVYGDISGYNVIEYQKFLRHYLFTTSAENLSKVCGCSEGLENKIKSLENEPFDNIIEKATSRRYPSSRIRRILCANALGLYQGDCKKFLETELYLKPLAVKKERADQLLSALAKSAFPIVSGINSDKLSPLAKECFEKDRYEFLLYNFLTHSDKKDYMITV